MKKNITGRSVKALIILIGFIYLCVIIYGTCVAIANIIELGHKLNGSY